MKRFALTLFALIAVVSAAQAHGTAVVVRQRAYAAPVVVAPVVSGYAAPLAVTTCPQAVVAPSYGVQAVAAPVYTSAVVAQKVVAQPVVVRQRVVAPARVVVDPVRVRVTTPNVRVRIR